MDEEVIGVDIICTYYGLLVDFDNIVMRAGLEDTSVGALENSTDSINQDLA